MSMSAAIENLHLWRERHEARRVRERLEEQEQLDDEEQPHPQGNTSTREIPHGTATEVSITNEETTHRTNTNTAGPAVDTVLEEGTGNDDDVTAGVRTEVVHSNEGGEVDEEVHVVPPSDQPDGLLRARGGTGRETVTLAELEEERELARRRTSACILLAVFVLFRLWIEAIVEGDPGLLLLCLVGTSWTVRFIRHNREREEELDRRISQYVESDGNNVEIDRNDLRMLSFQAQLALAIMESQRAMIQGGAFGNPDGPPGQVGVSDEARSHWHQYEYKTPTGNKPLTKKGGYGSVSSEEAKASGSRDEDDEEVAHCSICLCEYENGESLVRLPCAHVYHEQCVSSWTTNHVRCPLCNFDLESATDADTVTTLGGSSTTSSLALRTPPEDSIV